MSPVVCINFLSQGSDRSESGGCVPEFCHRADDHSAMFPPSLRTWFPPSVFPNVPAQPWAAHQTSVLHTFSFEFQGGALNLGNVAGHRNKVGTNITGVTAGCVQKHSPTKAKTSLLCGDLPLFVPDYQDKRWREQSLRGKLTFQSACATRRATAPDGLWISRIRVFDMA